MAAPSSQSSVLRYPLSNELTELARDVVKLHGGNFGLWYNKLIPRHSESFKTTNDKGGDKDAASYYARESAGFYKGLKPHLDKRHIEQISCCDAFAMGQAWRKITLHAVLSAPLALGLGEAHPNEISLLFDHALGVPFIPATSVKGVTRIAYLLGLLDDGIQIVMDKHGEYIDDTKPETGVPKYFGQQEQSGGIMFLDAYPIDIKSLKLDIINPHYGKYYQGESWPGDYLEPVPVKFLTVPAKTEFMFRALLNRDLTEGDAAKIKTALHRALAECGLGGKTAVGYGRFTIKSEGESPALVKSMEEENRKIQEQREQEIRAKMSPDEIMIADIRKLTTDADANKIGEICTRCRGGTYGREVFMALKSQLETLKRWEPKNDKQKLRNQEIEKRISG